jgi:hypothetical protein
MDYIRKHISVKAIQFTGDNIRAIQTFINGRDPVTHGNYAADKWEQYCTKVSKDGFIEIPSSLGYDPIYSKCLPSDYVVSPSPGVYSVMGKESFEDQYAQWEIGVDLKGQTTAEYLATVRQSDEALRTGYGPLSTELLAPDRVENLQVALQESMTGGGFAAGELVKRRAAVKAFLPQSDVDNLLKDLTIETERAIYQRDKFQQTGVSTASHGGSHDTCFGFILAKYIESDVPSKFGLGVEQFLSLDEDTRRALLWVAERMIIRLKVPEGEIPSEIIEGALERIQTRQSSSPVQITRPIETLDDAAALIQSYLRGEYGPLTRDEAEALATHRHYKGGLYYKLFDALHTETQEGMTVYLHLFPHEPGAYARPKLMFDSPNEAGETRFTPLR